MPERSSKNGWTMVAFGDVVQLIHARSADPAGDGYDRYVGLEHIEPNDLMIHRWGRVAEGTTFTNVFRTGQTLFGKRRAYQRKVAFADFDGVCSGDIYVLEPRTPKLLPELLPMLCQSEEFFTHAVGTSAGSLSPRTNWKSLATFEFALPPLEVQRRLIALLRPAVDYSERVDRLSEALAAAFQAALDAAFSAKLSAITPSQLRATEIGELPTSWSVQSLGAVCSKIVDGVHKRPDYVSQGIPFLTIENLNRGPGIDFSDTRFVTREDHEVFSRRANPERGDVLVSKDGTLGIARVVETDKEFSIFVSIALLKPDRHVLDSWFLRYYFDSARFRARLAARVAGSALKHIHLVDFRQSLIPVPPFSEQLVLVTKLREIDLTRRSALARAADARTLRRNLLQQFLWAGDA